MKVLYLCIFFLQLTTQVFSTCSSSQQGQVCIEGKLASDNVQYTIHSSYAGYVGIGIGGSGEMSGCDMYVAWKRSDNTVTLSKRAATGHSLPLSVDVDFQILALDETISFPELLNSQNLLKITFSRPIASSVVTIGTETNYMWAASSTLPDDVDNPASSFGMHTEFGNFAAVNLKALSPLPPAITISTTSTTATSIRKSETSEIASATKSISSVTSATPTSSPVNSKLEENSTFFTNVPISTIHAIHGILFFIAFVITPFLVIFLSNFMLDNKNNWLQKFAPLLVFIVFTGLTSIAGLLIELLSLNGPHFGKDMYGHKIMGLLSFVLILLFTIGCILVKNLFLSNLKKKIFNYIGASVLVFGILNCYMGLKLLKITNSPKEIEFTEKDNNKKILNDFQLNYIFLEILFFCLIFIFSIILILQTIFLKKLEKQKSTEVVNNNLNYLDEKLEEGNSKGNDLVIKPKNRESIDNMESFSFFDTFNSNRKETSQNDVSDESSYFSRDRLEPGYSHKNSMNKSYKERQTELSGEEMRKSADLRSLTSNNKKSLDRSISFNSTFDNKNNSENNSMQSRVVQRNLTSSTTSFPARNASDELRRSKTAINKSNRMEELLLRQKSMNERKTDEHSDFMLYMEKRFQENRLKQQELTKSHISKEKIERPMRHLSTNDASIKQRSSLHNLKNNDLQDSRESILSRGSSEFDLNSFVSSSSYVPKRLPQNSRYDVTPLNSVNQASAKTRNVESHTKNAHLTQKKRYEY
ncbi:hypothetical protein HDU92_000009 [Lobulomyces angularis]|nr:hypothetical protein HDU92_000009 [Lobulomyces angularis]